MMGIFIGALVGAFLGIFASAFANYKQPRFNTWFSRLFNSLGIENQCEPIDKCNNEKIYDDIICLDVGSELFSKIATDFIEQDGNSDFLITNIKEPWWFYKQFKDNVSSQKGGNKDLELILDDYEKLFKASVLDFNLINFKLDEFWDSYIKNGDIDVFPHLRTIFQQKKATRTRISFIDFNPNMIKTTSEYTKRNKDLHFYFFEKIINKDTSSYYVNRNKYHKGKFKGTDAIILNKKIILNHDDSTRDLIYVNKNLLTAFTTGFFHNITNDIETHKKNNTKIPFHKTPQLLDILYGIKI